VVILVDVGNTNAVFGIFDGDTLKAHFRLSTDPERTADEYAALILPLLERDGLEAGTCEAVMISSVVPTLTPTLRRLSETLFGHSPVFVGPNIKTGLPIRYKNPAEVGADRVVNAVAAKELYGSPVVVVDFGTATTFDLVNKSGEYVGGIITPGLEISAEALFSHASRLYRVDIDKPDELVADNTAGAMQSGLYFGYLGLVDGILERLLREVKGIKTVVATGGQSDLLAEGSRFIERVNPDLTLLGLKIIYDLNR
jgi:type III pantothenate kinase